MISEFIKTIKAYLYERATSPLAGALIISWCIWNYPIFIVLFSSLTPNDKIQIIESSLMNYQRSIWGPFVTTIFLIFIYPFPARLVYWFWRKQKKALREIKQKIENEELLSKEESRAIRLEIYNIQREHKQEIERKDTKVKNLKDVLQEREKKILQASNYSEELSHKEKEIADLKERLNMEASKIEAQLTEEQKKSMFRDPEGKRTSERKLADIHADLNGQKIHIQDIGEDSLGFFCNVYLPVNAVKSIKIKENNVEETIHFKVIRLAKVDFYDTGYEYFCGARIIKKEITKSY